MAEMARSGVGIAFEGDNGWKLALWFSVILNVNLAILNMLPIPVLDGGHILFGLIESVRRKPLNMRVLEVVQGVCTVLIIGAIAERMKFSAIMLFVVLWMFLVYFPLAHMVWGVDGWMNGVWNGDCCPV